MENRLQHYRKSQRMTLEQLSKRSGVSVNYISMIEHMESTPTVLIACRLSKALGVGIEDIWTCK